MSVANFPDTQYFVVLTASGGYQHPIGSFTVTTETELNAIQLYLTKVGTATGTERFRVNLYGNSESVSPIDTSDWVGVSELENHVNASDWYGYITFDFNRVGLNTDAQYYLTVECENYASPGDSYYWGVALDWPENMNTVAVANQAGAAMVIIGNRE